MWVVCCWVQWLDGAIAEADLPPLAWAGSPRTAQLSQAWVRVPRERGTAEPSGTILGTGDKWEPWRSPPPGPCAHLPGAA